MIHKTGVTVFRTRTKSRPLFIRENTRHFDKNDFEREPEEDSEDSFERKYREYAYANSAEESELDRARRARLRRSYFRWDQYDEDG